MNCRWSILAYLIEANYAAPASVHLEQLVQLLRRVGEHGGKRGTKAASVQSVVVVQRLEKSCRLSQNRDLFGVWGHHLAHSFCAESAVVGENVELLVLREESLVHEIFAEEIRTPQVVTSNFI